MSFLHSSHEFHLAILAAVCCGPRVPALTHDFQNFSMGNLDAA